MPVTVRHLGLQDYQTVWQAMQDFTLQRHDDTPDELWIVEHPAVYTLGLNGKREHLLNIGDIPVIHSDRGGQVTYHAQGQVIIYTLLDIKRLNINIRQLVSLLEQAMIDTLAFYGIVAIAKADAPGVYVQGKKIGSIGIRIKNSCSYHGLSFNNAMDLTPFNFINPCGYKDLKVTQLADLGVIINTTELASFMSQAIITALDT
ncbi:MAG: lipoyl(octanoyl) transferase LipB [Methylococcaceae bacterium]|nr:lipoyl(octanoyl) transferase LipB [Methylococcaceae bacterium]MDD1609630.1 lipoyl(octanoyl) transferase LipB [Methylococcaceae bacterium]MDD1616109.1 lipoyl(octanoyl) transferase LipB [Methylococcaceae bacterium]OYV18581.1 MAG: lipoyl(octanoyl) transferase [Methylococcaceae bacterium NSP1-2]